MPHRPDELASRIKPAIEALRTMTVALLTAGYQPDEILTALGAQVTCLFAAAPASDDEVRRVFAKWAEAVRSDIEFNRAGDRAPKGGYASH